MLEILRQEQIGCVRCPRLREHCETIAREKRRAYMEWEYWGKPVPGFGDPKARVLILGLAPGAHGSNRTGRPFTGDGSGNGALHLQYVAKVPVKTLSPDMGLVARLDELSRNANCCPSLHRRISRRMPLSM